MPRIGCLQFAPHVGDVNNNLNRADSLLNRVDQMELDDLDLLVLPEMAFSGYNFKSLQQITPYLEPSGSGISSLWARTTALKYDCIVAVGYPEKVDVSRNWPAAPEYYNSLIVVNGNGETVANYRKSFLYYTDETWALEGGGFFEGEIGDLGQVAMGICMDINPYKFQTPWNTFEFAVHVLEVNANLVILSMAWLTQEDSATFTTQTEEPDMETLSYWIQRLEPIIRKESEDEIIVVFCNRCGMEGEVTYAGTSAVIGIKNGEVAVYGLMGRGVKDILIVNTDNPPFAKLINRPDDVEQVPEPLSQPPESLMEDVAPIPIQDREASRASPRTSPGVSPRTSPGVSPGISPHISPGIPPPLSPHVSPHTSPRVSPPVPSPVKSPASPSIGSEVTVVTAIRVGQDVDMSESECEEDPIPRGGTPMVFPSPAPQCEVIEECATDCASECSSDCTSECGSSTGARTPTCPSPTPMSVRPKLEISTGAETLSSPRRQHPNGEGFFANHGAPLSSLGEGPHSALPKVAPFWGTHSSAATDVPDETNWSPLLTGSTMTHRSPWETELRSFARSPASRPSSRVTRNVPSPLADPHGLRLPVDREIVQPPLSPPPLSPRSPTSNFSRPFKTIDPGSPVRQFAELPANAIPIVASPSVFQTTFPRSASAFQEHFVSLNQAANEEFGGSLIARRGRSKSVSSLSPLVQKPINEQIPEVPEIPRPVSRAAFKERPPKRSPTKTPPPLSAGIMKHLAHSPTKGQGGIEEDVPQVPVRPMSRGRAQPSSMSGRRPSISPRPYPLAPQSPVEMRSPIWT